MPVTNEPCPDCRDEGKGDVPLEYRDGEFGAHCRNGHKLPDMSEIKARNAGYKSLPIRAAQAPKAPIPGLTTMEVKLPSKLKDALVSRFGDRLEASLPFFFGALLDPGAFIISGADAQDISGKAGVEVKNSQQLAGAIYSLKQDADNLNQKVKTLEASRGNGEFKAPTGGFVVKFSGEDVAILTEKAKLRQESVEELIYDVVTYAAEKGMLG